MVVRDAGPCSGEHPVSSAVDCAEGVESSEVRRQMGQSFSVDERRTELSDGISLTPHFTGMSTATSCSLGGRMDTMHWHVHPSSDVPLPCMRFSMGFAHSRLRFLSPVSPGGW